MAGYDDSHLSDIFDKAAKETQESRRPTLSKIMAAIAYKFDNNVFTVVSTPAQPSSALLHVSIEAGDQSLQVDDNGDGTFNVNHNGQEMFSRNTAEETVESIGRFYGKHSNVPPAKAPRGRNSCGA
jgi:hypothetical protein